MYCFFRSIRILALAMIFAVLATFAAADEASETSDGLHIEEAVVTRAQVGESARLRFKISNYGTRKVRLNSVRSDVAQDARLIMTLPGGLSKAVSGLPILQEETLNLATSHVQVELKELKQALLAGSTFEFEAVFQDFTLRAFAHVH